MMNDSLFSSIQGYLIDLDGVMYDEDELIEGAVEAIEYLNEKGIPHRFMTNTTAKPRQNLHKKMERLGIPARQDEIISPPSLAANYLRGQGNPSCYLAVQEETKIEFAEFRENETDPDFVIVGKIRDRWNYALMNQLFQMIVGGSKLIALHRDRYTQGAKGLDIEFGALIAGLEYSTSCKAMTIGKPERAFYRHAIDHIGLPPNRIAMIGDDFISDVQGAQNAGIKGIQVKTGKYREDLIARSPVTPDAIIPSIADLPQSIKTSIKSVHTNEK